MTPKRKFRGIREYTQQDYVAAQGNQQGLSSNRKRKRQREVTACKQCRARKISCDRSEPCTSCRKRGREDLCTYDYDADLDGSAEGDSGEVPKGAVDNPHSRPVQNNMTDERQTVYWGSHHWKQPTIEDMKWLATTNHLLASQMADMASLAAHFVSDRRRTLWNAASTDTKYDRIAIESQLQDLLPPSDICRIMVSRYLATFRRIYPIVDPEMLETRLNATQNKHTGHIDGLEMTALYLAIVGLGHQLPALPGEDLGSHRAKRRDGKALMASLRPLILNLVQQVKRPTVIMLQSLICLVLQEKMDLDWVDGNNSTAGLLALLGRMLLSLGLHRDPGRQGSVSEGADLRIRRNLFWSLALLDLEHAVYSGHPCTFPFQSSDVKVPSVGDAGDWLSRAAESLPQLATGLHAFHDSMIQSVSPLLNEKSSNSGRLATNPADSLNSQATLAEEIIAAIGDAFWECLSNHLRLAANLTVFDSTSTSAAARFKAQDLIFERLSMNLSKLKRVANAMDSAPADSRSTWLLLVSSLLRCPIYYTCSVTFMMATRMNSNPNTSTRNTTDAVVRDAKAVHKLLEGAVAFSYDNLKHSILLQMQVRTMEERATLAKEQAKSGQDNSADDRLVVLATQQAIEYGIRVARMAIDRACNSDDPPPNLIVAAHDEAGSTENAGLDASTEMSCPPDMMSLFGQADWSALFDEWLVEAGAVPTQ